MGLTIYGPRRSMAARCYWMLEEIGVSYAARADTDNDASLRAACEALVGVFQVPVLEDADAGLVLCESHAINHYLARRFAPELLGAGVCEQSQALRWAFWAASKLDEPARAINDLPHDERSGALDRASDVLGAAIAELGRALAQGPFIIGETFSLADIAVGSAVGSLMVAGYPIESAPVANWMGSLFSRPAAARLMSQLEPD